MDESKVFDASSKLETNCSEDKQGNEHYTEPEDSDEMFHQEASDCETGKSEDEEFDNSSNTSYFFKMRKMMLKSMVSLAVTVRVAFLAINFSVWGIQLPFAEGQRLSQIGSHAMFNGNFLHLDGPVGFPISAKKLDSYQELRLLLED